MQKPVPCKWSREYTGNPQRFSHGPPEHDPPIKKVFFALSSSYLLWSPQKSWCLFDGLKQSEGASSPGAGLDGTSTSLPECGFGSVSGFLRNPHQKIPKEDTLKRANRTKGNHPDLGGAPTIPLKLVGDGKWEPTCRCSRARQGTVCIWGTCSCSCSP